MLAVAALYVLSGDLMMKLPQGKLLLPFGMMALSALIYFLNQRTTSFYYAPCQLMIRVIALTGFYLGGNYLVVREGNAKLSGLLSPPQIPFAAVFYILTALVPLLYIFLGLKNKDRLLLIIGLITCAFSCFSYRYYFDFFPVEIDLVLSGLIILSLSAFFIHYLRSPKSGFSDEKENTPNQENLEAALLGHHFGQSPQGTDLEFGGGNFGGGGAGNEY
jgi:hypothetical protein